MDTFSPPLIAVQFSAYMFPHPFEDIILENNFVKKKFFSHPIPVSNVFSFLFFAVDLLKFVLQKIGFYKKKKIFEMHLKNILLLKLQYIIAIRITIIRIFLRIIAKKYLLQYDYIGDSVP